MIITLGHARTELAEFAGKAGKCPDSEAVRLFVMEVVERLLRKGAHGNLRKWKFCLCDSAFTAPPDLEVPLKFKLGSCPERVWSQWYEFSDVQAGEDHDYNPGIFEEVNDFCTVYDLPQSGARVAAIPLVEESDDAVVTIQGLDPMGKEIFTRWHGEQIHGERLKITYKKPVFTKNVFSKITAIEKSLTKDYVRLDWVSWDPNLKLILARGLLGLYRPVDVNPSMRRFRVPNVANCCTDISIIGRVRLMQSYHDNDILPIANMSALKSMAQTINAERNNQLDVAAAQSGVVDQLIEDENQYKRTGQDPVDFDYEYSPGSNRNLM